MSDHSPLALALLFNWGFISICLKTSAWGIAGYLLFRIAGGTDRKWWLAAFVTALAFITWEEIVPLFVNAVAALIDGTATVAKLVEQGSFTPEISKLALGFPESLIGFVVGRWLVLRFESRILASAESEEPDEFDVFDESIEYDESEETSDELTPPPEIRRLNRAVRWIGVGFLLFMTTPFLFSGLLQKLRRPEPPERIQRAFRDNLKGLKPLQSIYIYADNVFCGMGGLVERNGNRIILSAAHVFHDTTKSYTFSNSGWTTHGEIKLALNLDDPAADLAIAFPDSDHELVQISNGPRGMVVREVMDGPLVRSMHSENEDKRVGFIRSCPPRANNKYMLQRILEGLGGESGQIYTGESGELFVLTSSLGESDDPKRIGSTIIAKFPFTVVELESFLNTPPTEFAELVARLVKLNRSESILDAEIDNLMAEKPGLEVIGMLVPQREYMTLLSKYSDTGDAEQFLRIYDLGIRSGKFNSATTAALLDKIEAEVKLDWKFVAPKATLDWKLVAREMAKLDEANLFLGERYAAWYYLFHGLGEKKAAAGSVLDEYYAGLYEAVRGKPRSGAIMVNMMGGAFSSESCDKLRSQLAEEMKHMTRDADYAAAAVLMGNAYAKAKEWDSTVQYYDEYVTYYEGLNPPAEVGGGNYDTIILLCRRLIYAHARLGNIERAAEVCSLYNRELARSMDLTFEDHLKEAYLHRHAYYPDPKNPIDPELLNYYATFDAPNP